MWRERKIQVIQILTISDGLLFIYNYLKYTNLAFLFRVQVCWNVNIFFYIQFIYQLQMPLNMYMSFYL